MPSPERREAAPQHGPAMGPFLYPELLNSNTPDWYKYFRENHIRFLLNNEVVIMSKFIQGKFMETLSTGFHFSLHVEDAGMDGILCLPQTFQSEEGEALYALLAFVESEDALDRLEDLVQAMEGHTKETKAQVVLEELGLSHLPDHGDWALAQMYKLWSMVGRYVEDEEEVFFQSGDVYFVDAAGNRYEAVVED